VLGRDASLERRGAAVDTFQAISIMFVFGMFILSLLSYIEKRK